MKLQKSYLKKGLLALAVSSALTGCFDDNDDNAVAVGSGTSTTTTTFPVTVDVPASLVPQTASAFDWKHPIKSLMNAAYALTVADLGKENFEVVVVDGDGNVIEVVPADQIEVEDLGNGQYEISVPGNPQLNCLIVLDLDNSLTIVADETNINDTNALFAPTTSTEGVDIDLESTVAYQQFLEDVDANAFEDGTYDVTDPGQVAAIEELVNNVEQQLESVDLESIITNNGLTIEQFLAADDEGSSDQAIIDALAAIEAEFEAEVDAIINEQLEDVQNAITTTVASFANTGIYWFEEGEYGVLTSGQAETYYEFDEEGGEWVAETFDATTDTPSEDYFLTADGWVQSSDFFEVSSADTDAGTVVIQDVALNIAAATLTTLQAVDLYSDGERSVQDFVQTRDDEEFAEYLSAATTFSEGAVAVKVGIAPNNENHILWFHDGEGEDGSCWGNGNEFPADYNGNCETVYVQGQSFATSLTDLVTDIESTPNDDAFVGFTLYGEDDQYIYAQLIETTDEDNVTSRNARFFTMNDEQGWDLYVDAESGSQPTWSYTQPTGLAEGESIIELPIPEELQDIIEDAAKIFAVKDGYVRPGHKEVAGGQEETDWVYNSIAADDILTAFLPTSELYQTFANQAFTVTMTSDSDLERLEFFSDGTGTIEFTSTSNEPDINDLSTWTVDPATNELSFREFSDETNYWDWVLTLTVNSDESISFTAAVSGVEDGQAVTGSGAGSMEVENFAYASSDLAGNTFYIAWYNDGDDEPDCNVGWIEETLTFDNAGGYSIAEADCIGGGTEQGSFSVSASGVVTLDPTTADASNDYFQRVGIDTFYNADMVCGDDTEALAEQCTLDDSDAYLFTTTADRTDFITAESPAVIPQ